MELYESMNEKIADIIAIDGTPSSLYASAYIKDLRAENARLKSKIETVKQQAVKEFADRIISVLDEMGMERSSEYNDSYDDGVTDCITNIKSCFKPLYPND